MSTGTGGYVLTQISSLSALAWAFNLYKADTQPYWRALKDNLKASFQDNKYMVTCATVTVIVTVIIGSIVLSSGYSNIEELYKVNRCRREVNERRIRMRIHVLTVIMVNSLMLFIMVILCSVRYRDGRWFLTSRMILRCLPYYILQLGILLNLALWFQSLDMRLAS